jgi:hypothetical protein
VVTGHVDPDLLDQLAAALLRPALPPPAAGPPGREAVRPWRHGGPASLGNLILLCPFHHLVAVHRSGWKIALNSDGTTTARYRGRELRSHAPPAGRAA